LRVSQKADWNAWIEFFLTGVAEQAMDGVERATKLMALWQDYRKTPADRACIDSRAELGRSIVYAAGHECRPRSSATTRLIPQRTKYVMRLVKLGILKEIDRAEAQSDFYRAGNIATHGRLGSRRMNLVSCSGAHDAEVGFGVGRGRWRSRLGWSCGRLGRRRSWPSACTPRIPRRDRRAVDRLARTAALGEVTDGSRLVMRWNLARPVELPAAKTR